MEGGRGYRMRMRVRATLQYINNFSSLLHDIFGELAADADNIFVVPPL
jgi:hypothetical protein